MTQRYVIRAHMSGVWLDAEILGDGVLPGTVRVRGRRAHRWYGAIDCSDLAHKGPDSRSRVTRQTTVDLQPTDIYEVHPMSEAAVAAVRALPVAEPT